MAHHQPDPFWDFIRNFDPNNAGAGVNGNNNNGPSPEFLRGFPFFHPAQAFPAGPPGHGPGGPGGPPHHGPGGPPHHGGRHGHRHHGPPRGSPRGPPPNAWAGPFAWADWGNPSHGGAPWFQQPPQTQETNNTQSTEQPAAAATTNNSEKVQEKEKPGSPDTMMGDSDAPDPAEVTPDEDEEPQTSNNPPPYARGHGRRGAGRRCRDRESCRQNTQGGSYPFDLSALLNNLSSHPFVQNIQAQAAEACQAATSGATGSSSSSNFSPPLDLFSTPSAYVLHLSIPGALKSDIGVDWDPERKVLRVAGVVHRPGDEEFQTMLVQSERRTGVFEREVRLPPKTWGAVDENGREDEVDAEGITAKMEDGVLIVTVPKVEKEWTEIRKVDIE
jgi:HSP20 family protein